MFFASIAAIAMFVMPLYGWRIFNNVMCAAKNRQIKSHQVCPMILTGVAISLLPLVLLVIFASGLTALCGAIAWVVGAVFWMFNH